jgi:phosphoglycerate kinase
MRQSLETLPVEGKVVLLRTDLNVPIVHNRIEDITRITRLVPTINYLVERNAKLVLLSHFGRPKGQFKRDMSLAPLADELSKILNK